MSATIETALITGGGSGIGLAIANVLCFNGYRVAIAGRRQQQLAKAADESGQGSRLIYHQVDVTDRDSVRQLVEWALSRLNSIDMLVNAAGINVPTRSMHELQPEQWDQLMLVNATGAYNCMRAVLPHMRDRQHGLVVNISSMAAKDPKLGGVAYAASKTAMSALGFAVGSDEAKNGVRVTNICPGPVDSPFQTYRGVPIEDAERAKMLKPGDVAQLVVAVSQLPARVHVTEIAVRPAG